jgi:hypothetical protein
MIIAGAGGSLGLMQVAPLERLAVFFLIPSDTITLAGLVSSRSRRIDLFLIAWQIALNPAAGFGRLPESQFAKQIGVATTSHAKPGS